MEGGGGEDPGEGAWSDNHFQAHSTTGAFNTSQAQVYPSTSQGVVSSFSDGHLQAVLGQGTFHHVYQPGAGTSGTSTAGGQQPAAAPAPQASYARLSPTMEYPTSASTDALSQFRVQSSDGTSIIRLQAINDGGNQQLVTVLLSNNTLATTTPEMAQQLEQMIPVSIATPSHIPQASTSSQPVVMTTMGPPISTSGSVMVSSALANHREHVVSQLEADSGDQSVGDSQNNPLLQVVTSLHQAESTTSEATPLVHGDVETTSDHTMTLSLHHSNKVDTYSSEPDTTSEELGQSYTHHLHRQQSYAEPHSSAHHANGLDLGHHGTIDMGHASTSNGLQGNVANDVTMATVSQPAMDPSIDTSGIIAHTPGTESELELLVSADQSVMQMDQSQGLINGHMTEDPTNEEPRAGPSTEYVRKSLRLAIMDSSTPRPRWSPQSVYNVADIWCEKCKMAYTNSCVKHPKQVMEDKVVLSRAWASLPPQLQIFRLAETTELGVFSRRTIPSSTQLGPFIGELVETREQLTNPRLLLQLDHPNGEMYYIEASNEIKCNWMMFVRPATTWEEQNLVMYQHNGDIYYETIKNVEPKQELKVWYAAHYAHRLGMTLLEPLDDDVTERWACYECNERFKTSALLHKHLSVHDDSADLSGLADYDDDERDPTVTSYARGTRRKGFLSKNGNKKSVVKKESPSPEEGTIPGQNADNSSQNWKKKKTSIYLNKYKKYHQETIKKSIKSLYKKKGKECGGQEWVCTHCELTFDNSSLLNLHTLTHAAEDIGLQEIQKLCGDGDDVDVTSQMGVTSFSEDGDHVTTTLTSDSLLRCPVCHEEFTTKGELISHASEHGKTKRRGGESRLTNPNKPHKCSKCWKAFTTKDRLTKHMLCHGAEENKPLQCSVCNKRFMNNSALACHLKTHSDRSYYECPLCRECFDQVAVMKSHVTSHAVNGVYTCPECHKTFAQYSIIRKHMRAFHSEKKFPCSECDKVFPRPDKLKLHMLRHSAHREFMCETCGRLFKRKDKLKEHDRRLHGPDNDRKSRQKAAANQKKFVPKVSPNDYHRFIYKCHSCMLGFKRRGMLVNHIAKRHPEMRPEHVPELNLPILRTQRDYFCQYCEKVYKSSSKRKAHIVKNHPGSELPLSSRKKSLYTELPGLANPTYSQAVGSVTTVPHPCQYCHKQYASKAKLLQHQRKKHADYVPPAQRRPAVTAVLVPGKTLLMNGGDTGERYVTVETVGDGTAPDTHADLLTQAMSELHQTMTLDYRNQVGAEYETVTTSPGIVTTPGVNVIQPIQTSTIELSHLGQTLGNNIQTLGNNAQAQLVNNVQTFGNNVQALGNNMQTFGNNGQTLGNNVQNITHYQVTTQMAGEEQQQEQQEAESEQQEELEHHHTLTTVVAATQQVTVETEQQASTAGTLEGSTVRYLPRTNWTAGPATYTYR